MRERDVALMLQEAARPEPLSPRLRLIADDIFGAPIEPVEPVPLSPQIVRRAHGRAVGRAKARWAAAAAACISMVAATLGVSLMLGIGVKPDPLDSLLPGPGTKRLEATSDVDPGLDRTLARSVEVVLLQSRPSTHSGRVRAPEVDSRAPEPIEPPSKDPDPVPPSRAVDLPDEAPDAFEEPLEDLIDQFVDIANQPLLPPLGF